MIDKIVPQKFVTDKDQRLIKPGEMIDAENVTIIERGEGSEFVIKTMKGHDSADPNNDKDKLSGEVKVIGKVSDEQRGFVYLFVTGVNASPSGSRDAIYQYDVSSNKYKQIVKSARLNFDEASFVKADVLNKSFKRDGTIETALYFTDNVNPPRKINVDRALSGDYDAFLDNQNEFDIGFGAIAAGSTKPPTFRFETDENTLENNFEQNLFQFATQIIYKDGEVSALSPYSKLAVSQASVFGGIEDNAYGAAKNTQNVCVIKHEINTDHPDIKSVRILARKGNNGVFFVVDEFDPAEDVTRNVMSNSVTVYTAETGEYKFYNDSLGFLISDTEANKLYDNVPQTAEGQSITASRLMYSNYEEGYPNHTMSTYIDINPQYSSSITGANSFITTGDTALIFNSSAGSLEVNLDLEDGTLMDDTTEIPAGTSFLASFKFGPEFEVTKSGGGDVMEVSGTYVVQGGIGTVDATWTPASATVDFTDITSTGYVELKGQLPEAMSTDEMADFFQAKIDGLDEVECQYDIAGMSFATSTPNAVNFDVDSGKARVFWKFGEDADATDDRIQFKPRISRIRLDVDTDVSQDPDGGTNYLILNPWNVLAVNGDDQDELVYSSITDPLSSEFIEIDSVGSVQSFKAGANHAFGVVYYDKYGRSGNVQELGNVYVQSVPERSSNPGPVGMQFNLSASGFNGPSWAQSYQIVYAGSSVSNVFQYTAGGAYARRLTTDTAGSYDLDTSVHNIYVSLKTLDQYSRDKSTLRDYSFTKGDKLRVIAHRSDDDSSWVYPESSKGNPIEFDVVGFETIDGAPISTSTSDATTYDSSDIDPYEGRFLVLTAPTVEGTAANTTDGDVDKYVGFDWYQITGTNYNSSVTLGAVDNKWGQNVLFEIITPTQSTAEKVYYEIGERRQLGGHRTIGIGAHGPSFVVNSGDVRFRPVACKTPKYVSNAWNVDEPEAWEYQTRMLEDHSISDLYESKSWDRGRAHVVFKDAATIRRRNSIIYSDAYAEDSAVLSLSSFTSSLANFLDLPSENGRCSYIGNMSEYLMAIQEDKVNRLSVNKSILSTAQDGGVVGLNSKVLNLMTPFDESFGTSNPESVIIHDGFGFFYDQTRLKIIKFNAGQMVSISDKDIKSFFEKYAGVSRLGSDHRVVSGYDPSDDVYYVSLSPTTLLLPDGMTIGYNNGMKVWQGKYSFVPDDFATVEDKMLMFGYKAVAGTFADLFIHRHNATTQSNDFYNSDTRATSVVEVVSTAGNPSKVKAYDSISLESDKAWTVTLESSRSQTTDELSFIKKEGAFYAPVSGDTSSQSKRHLIPVGTVSSVDGATITLRNSLRGVHVPTGYLVYRENDSQNVVGQGVHINAVDRSNKKLTLSSASHSITAQDNILVAGDQTLNGDKIRGHYCKIKCTATPGGSQVRELYAINAKVTNSQHSHG